MSGDYFKLNIECICDGQVSSQFTTCQKHFSDVVMQLIEVSGLIAEEYWRDGLIAKAIESTENITRFLRSAAMVINDATSCDEIDDIAIVVVARSAYERAKAKKHARNPQFEAIAMLHAVVLSDDEFKVLTTRKAAP